VTLLFRVGGWCCLAAIVVATLVPGELRPTTAAPANLERLVAFATTGALFWLGYPRHKVLVTIGLVLAAGVLELAQLLAPMRHARLEDFLVKSAGVVLGALGGEVLHRVWALGRGMHPRSARTAQSPE